MPQWGSLALPTRTMVVLFFTGLSLLTQANTQLAAGDPALSNSLEDSTYFLAVGDRIKIHVLGQGELSIEARVSDTGEIIYPLLGEIAVVGLSREQVAELLYSKLKPDYLVEPVVSVSILSYRQVFLQGEVSKTGPYPYTPGLSLRRALLNAGGFTDLANKSKIYVVNEFDPEGKEYKVDQNYKMKPGDIVTVKASFF